MPRWQEITSEPNSPEPKALRLKTLAAARRPPVPQRLAYLRDLARGRRVLDVGVVAHAFENEAKDEWLHRPIAEAAGYCLGVDILPESVEKLRAAGYNVRLCDITRDDPGETFELLVVGEVIEHLHDPGSLFAAAGRLLVPGGLLALTTPNPFYWKCIRNNIGLKKNRCESPDHVTFFFPSGIAELAERFGLVLESFRGVPMRRNSPLAETARRLLTPWLVHPEFFYETIIYECRRVACPTGPLPR